MADEDPHESSALVKFVNSVRDATLPILNVNAVGRAGYTPLTGRVSGPDHGAVGVRYIRTMLVADGEMDGQLPEAILY